MKRLILGVALATALVGCSTSYKSDGFRGGFSDSVLAKDTFSVSFRGNKFTKASKTRDLAMLRGAELAYQNGYDYFSVLNGGTQTRTKEVELTGASSSTNASVYGSLSGNQYNAYGNSQTTYNAPTTATISAHNSQYVIKGYNANNAPSNALSTIKTINRLKSKYKIK